MQDRKLKPGDRKAVLVDHVGGAFVPFPPYTEDYGRNRISSNSITPSSGLISNGPFDYVKIGSVQEGELVVLEFVTDQHTTGDNTYVRRFWKRVEEGGATEPAAPTS